MNDDPRADARWLSYGELAAARGISRSSAIRMARRYGWKRQTGNDGTARVAVPVAAIEGKPKPIGRATEDVTEDSPEGSPPGQNSIIRVLEDQIADLRAQSDLANDRADRAEQRADRAEARLDQVLADLRNERVASGEERRRLLERIAELEAQLAKQSEPPAAEPLGPDVDAISADLEHEASPPSAWLEEAWGAGASNDHSATADPAHQVERLWQRIEELEHRLEAAKAERAGEKPPTSADQAAATAQAEGDTVPEAAARPRRWWRRVLTWR